MVSTSDYRLTSEGRLMSLDFFRGLTMFLLIGESTALYSLLASSPLEGTLLGWLGQQLQHHPWNGLRPWDLVQPFFMFIVGVAMPFSFGRRWARGDSWRVTRHHAARRSIVLLFLGWALYCIGPGRLTFELWNVLAQLAFTYFIAFLLMRKPVRTQLLFTLGLLLLTELLYRGWPVPGFNEPFVPDRNFGSWVDLLLMGKLSGGHWVAFNAVPTTAHTMWGVLAGQVILSERAPSRKIGILVFAGLAGIVLGYALNPLTPIIKRICTSSFVIVSGGYCLIAFALSYWLIDIKKSQKWAKWLTCVGMNPIFIYLFTETGGARWLRRIATPFTQSSSPLVGELAASILTGMAVWFLLWYLCYWLQRRRIFLKI